MSWLIEEIVISAKGYSYIQDPWRNYLIFRMNCWSPLNDGGNPMDYYDPSLGSGSDGGAAAASGQAAVNQNYKTQTVSNNARNKAFDDNYRRSQANSKNQKPQGTANASQHTPCLTSTTSEGRGYLVSMVNGTVGWGLAGTFDLGFVVDAQGNSKMYFTFGGGVGYGASVGMGIYGTNTGFNVNDLNGTALNLSLSIPGIDYVGGEHSRDYIFGESPYPGGQNVSVSGINVGAGSSSFLGYTNTIVFDSPPADFWCRPGRR